MTNGTLSATSYVNPTAPVHVLGGTAGAFLCDYLIRPQPVWSAFRSMQFGYLQLQVRHFISCVVCCVLFLLCCNSLVLSQMLQVPNATHIQFSFLEQVSGSVVDSFWVEQHHHGPFAA